MKRSHVGSLPARLKRAVPRHVFHAFLILSATACGGGGGDGGSSQPTAPATPVLTTLSVSLSASSIEAGSTSVATASGKDQFGAPIAIGTVTWSSSATSVATVSGSGVVTGVVPGQATINAAVGSVTGTTALTVRAVDIAACRLPANFSGVALGFPRVAGRLKAVGDVRVPVVFVDFSDAVATRTPQAVFGLVSPVAENFYKAVSYGRMNLILQPTYTWYRMSKASSQYGWNALTFDLHKAYIQEALNLATTTDFSQADGFLIMSNPDAGVLNNGPAFTANAGNGVTVRGTTLLNGATSGRDFINWGAYWLNHEMGHALGLPDLYAFSGTTHRFVGNFSMMGQISGFAREYFAWERWQLGWLDDSQISCESKVGTHEISLSPVERVGGTKMIVIPTGATSAILVESRRAEGYDTNGSFSPGVLVYTIDTSIPTGNGVLKVLPINDSDTSKGTAPLQVGGVMTVGGVTITYVSTDANGDKVRVTR